MRIFRRKLYALRDLTNNLTFKLFQRQNVFVGKLIIAFFGAFCLFILLEIFILTKPSNSKSNEEHISNKKEDHSGDFGKKTSDVNTKTFKNIIKKTPPHVDLKPIIKKRIFKYNSIKKEHVYLPEEYKGPFDFELGGSMGKDGVWQPVNGTSHKFYVYSAFIDDRNEKKFIRIIAVTKTFKSDGVFCKLYYKNAKEVLHRVIKASVNTINENWGLEYSAAFVICPLGGTILPSSVSVITSRSVSPNKEEFLQISNQLLIKEPVSASIFPDSANIGACIKPLHYNYGKALDLIEYIELNRILGVTKFTFYNHTVSPAVSCVLNHYIKKDIAEVLPWKLNIKSQKEIRTEGIFASLNDCLYRNMRNFEYLMFTDLDEFLIPKEKYTLKELLEELNVRNGGKDAISTFSFQNTFFYLQFPDDFSLGSKLRIFRKTQRKNSFNPHNQRSKYICVPHDVNEVGNHFIWDYQPYAKKTVHVPIKDAFMHHYRVCEFGGDDCVKDPSIKDDTVSKYKPSLILQVEKVIQSLEEICPKDAKSLKESL